MEHCPDCNDFKVNASVDSEQLFDDLIKKTEEKAIAFIKKGMPKCYNDIIAILEKETLDMNSDDHIKTVRIKEEGDGVRKSEKLQGGASSTSSSARRPLVRVCVHSKTNPVISQLHNAVAKIAEEMVDGLYELKLWLKFLQPRSDSGHSLGLEAQNEVLSEIEDTLSIITKCNTYAFEYNKSIRGETVENIDKCPNLQLLRDKLVFDDLDEYQSIYRALKKMSYCILVIFDRLYKNLDLVLNPRAGDATETFTS